jgi:3-dehydroquinate synthetase
MSSIQFLSKFDLPDLDIDDKDTFINFVKNDKKFRNKKIRFILLDEIGKSRISEDISFDQIKESLSEL